ncbi:MAG: HlyC/CorC family transporter [Qingshengfaniella sp.]
MNESHAIDPALWIMGGAILVLLLLSAFFSGSETALTAASRAKLRNMAQHGSRGARVALKLTEDSERLIGGILLGNNMVNILATSLATSLFTRTLGDSGVAAATLVMTAMVLIFSEVLPKTYAITNTETAAARVATPIRVVTQVLAPVVAVVQVIVRSVLRLFGVTIDPDRNVLSVHEEIVGALQLGHSEGVVHKEDRDRLLGALDLRERIVEEIMRHRSNIEMIDAAASPQDVLRQVINSPHTRLPVFRGHPENIIGVIHAKDLLRAVHALLADDTEGGLEGFDFLAVARKPYFVPETTTLDDQMRQFLKRQTHFALVVDEYGDLQGLITLEDILEEIVGEIADEFDNADDEAIAQAPDGKFIVDGAMTIRDLNRAHDWQLPDTEANTVAGLVIHEAQMIPVPGQVFVFHGVRFEVAARENNRITQIKVSPAKPKKNAATG